MTDCKHRPKTEKDERQQKDGFFFNPVIWILADEIKNTVCLHWSHPGDSPEQAGNQRRNSAAPGSAVKHIIVLQH